MNNVELEQKVQELIRIENYFDFVLAVKKFKKEYKTSDFYKATKKPLGKMIKEARMYYALQLKDLGRHLQSVLDGLTLDHVNAILDKMSGIFAQENEEIKEGLEVFKDLKG